jgi:SAM-dependent methyltransferase
VSVEGFRDASTDLLLDLARPSRHDVVLDYACGVGMAALALASVVKQVQAIDELADSLDEGRRLAAELDPGAVDFLLFELSALPFADGAFSLVVCQDALHRLPAPAAALAEMARVTSPGGRIVVLDLVVDGVTDDALNELARLRDPGHRGYRTANRLAALAEEAGLGIAEQRLERRTVDLEYWLQAAAVPAQTADLVRLRLREMTPAVQERLDLAFADDLVSFSFDVLGLRLERA